MLSILRQEQLEVLSYKKQNALQEDAHEHALERCTEEAIKSVHDGIGTTADWLEIYAIAVGAQVTPFTGSARDEELAWQHERLLFYIASEGR